MTEQTPRTGNKLNDEDDDMLALGYSWSCGRGQCGSCCREGCACGCHKETSRVAALEAKAAALYRALEAEHAGHYHQTRDEWVKAVGWDADAGKTDPAKMIWRDPRTTCKSCAALQSYKQSE